MRSNPMIGYYVSLLIVVATLGWFGAQWIASEDIWRALGDLSHVITFLSILLLLSAIPVAALFHRIATVKSDLIHGRDVVGRWHVSESEWQRFAGKAGPEIREERWGVLMLILFFVVVVCGGLALVHPRDWVIFFWIGVGIMAMVTVAYLVGGRIDTAQLRYTTGDVIIGKRGLLINGVLHVWGYFLSWLQDAQMVETDPPRMAVVYGYVARYGPQYITVRLPIAAGCEAEAERAIARLLPHAGRRKRRGRAKPAAASPGQPLPPNAAPKS